MTYVGFCNNQKSGRITIKPVHYPWTKYTIDTGKLLPAMVKHGIYDGAGKMVIPVGSVTDHAVGLVYNQNILIFEYHLQIQIFSFQPQLHRTIRQINCNFISDLYSVPVDSLLRIYKDFSVIYQILPIASASPLKLSFKMLVQSFACNFGRFYCKFHRTTYNVATVCDRIFSATNHKKLKCNYIT